MSGLPREETLQLSNDLQHAVLACSERGLYHSAKWASELLNSMASADDSVEDSDTEVDDDGPLAGANESIFTSTTDRIEQRLRKRDFPKYLMAKSLFDCREYDRCAATLLPSLVPQTPLARGPLLGNPLSTPGKGRKFAHQSTAVQRDRRSAQPAISQRSLFLALYAKYLAGEKRKEEDSEMLLGPVDGPVTLNRELTEISKILEDYLEKPDKSSGTSSSEGFLEYLYGVILLKGKNSSLAKQWLLKSVGVYQWNWSAWQELAGLVDSVDELDQMCRTLPTSIPAFLFGIHCAQELYQSSERLHDKLNQISNVFPSSAFIQTQRALLHYHAKEFIEASTIFSSLLRDHPYRLDSLDVYSNILYVLDDQRPTLSYLSTVASATDKFRPETCCIIANYYSKASEHEKAVMYFRRALTLDRSFLSAWTLMGHEYIELKNIQAAIESYRRAVDANKKDYRAWHGLGLGYELLDMHSYALYYFQKAAALQPYDPKMWMAVGNSFEHLERPQIHSAIRAYKRAVAASSPTNSMAGLGSGLTSDAGPSDPLAGAVGGVYDADILEKLALLYERAGDIDEAAAYMELCLAQEEGPDEEDLLPGQVMPDGPTGIGVTQTTSRARLWLARYAFARRDWQRATELANELCQDGVEVEEAKALIRDVRARMGMAAGGDPA